MTAGFDADEYKAAYDEAVDRAREFVRVADQRTDGFATLAIRGGGERASLAIADLRALLSAVLGPGQAVVTLPEPIAATGNRLPVWDARLGPWLADVAHVETLSRVYWSPEKADTGDTTVDDLEGWLLAGLAAIREHRRLAAEGGDRR